MIAAVELLRVQLELLRPHVYSGGTERVRDLILVCVHADDGRRGWGECSTLGSAGYAELTTARAWIALRDQLAPEVLRGGNPPYEPSMAGAALEEAVLDRALHADGVALADWLTRWLGPRRDAAPWCAVIGLGSHDELVERVGAAVDAGATQVKLKIAPAHDVEPLRIVRTTFPRVDLAADANCSYPSPAAVPRVLADIGLAYLEQPLAPDDIDGCATLARGWPVPIALDESLTSADRLTAAVAAFDTKLVASVKVGRLGGVQRSVRALEVARDSGVDCFVGGMLETAVGRSIALAFAVQGPCNRPTDVGPTARYFDADIGPAFEAGPSGSLSALTGPGIGFHPDRDELDRVLVDRVVVTR